MLADCEACANGKHGMKHPKFPDTCLCCREVVGEENLMPNPFGWII